MTRAGFNVMRSRAAGALMRKLVHCIWQGAVLFQDLHTTIEVLDPDGSTTSEKMCSGFRPIFFVEFLVKLDVTSTGCVALCCVAFCCLLRIVLCCYVL